MRVLQVHNLYQNAGGEDAVFEAEGALLRAAGHDVHVETVSNHGISSLSAKVKAYLNAPHDAARKLWVQNLISDTRPEILHVHNFFPLLTPAVHEAAAELGVPVVQSLHNFRVLCANAMLTRDGAPCEKCVSGSRAWALVHRCYRGSFLGSLALVRMQDRAFRLGTWKRVPRFIALTEFSRDKFIEGGLPPELIVVKPNFVQPSPDTSFDRAGGLFVGRLSPEKGADVLIAAWRRLPDYPLIVIGDGPERARLEATAPSNVKFLGHQSPEIVGQYMTRAALLVVPSICYEGFPMVVAEAFAKGLPVVASETGSLAEIVETNVNGVHFRAGDGLHLANVLGTLLSTASTLAKLGAGAKRTYLEKYTPELNLRQLEAIYHEAVNFSKDQLN